MDPGMADHVFQGDDRGFSYTSQSFRMRQIVILQPFQEDSGGGWKDGSKKNLTGITRAYDKSTSLDSAGNLTPAAKADMTKGHPLMCDFAQASPDSWTITVTRITNRKVIAYFRAAASDPLVIPAPDIDWEFWVTIDSTNESSPTYIFQGAHDGFPAYDIYINGKLIYGHDPRTTGDGIFSLFAPMEYDQVYETGTLTP